MAQFIFFGKCFSHLITFPPGFIIGKSTLGQAAVVMPLPLTSDG